MLHWGWALSPTILLNSPARRFEAIKMPRFTLRDHARARRRSGPRLSQLRRCRLRRVADAPWVEITLVDIVRYPQRSVRGYPIARTLFGRKSAEQTDGSIWCGYLHSPHPALSYYC